MCVCVFSRPLTELSFYCVSIIIDMRRDVQEIFKATPHEKQVMMFSATLAKEIRPVCKKFMNNVNLSSPLSLYLCSLVNMMSCFGC